MTDKVYRYSTSITGLHAYDFLGEYHGNERRRMAMTMADWAKEQLLVLARDEPVTRAELEKYMAHVRDTIVDGTFPVSDPEKGPAGARRSGGKETCAVCTYAIEHLDSLLRELHDCGLVRRRKV